MSKIVDAVSIIFTSGDEIFSIQRQLFLKAFPGYWAFPGGKVEVNDEIHGILHQLTQALDQRLLGAVIREAQEELGIDIREELKAAKVNSIDFLGLAITPDFNPYRFATYFFKIDLKEKLTFVVDRNEARLAKWMSSIELLQQFNRGHILAVPPVIKVIETLGRDPHVRHIPDLNFTYDSTNYVPYIESIRSVRQIMPLSNTLPPATRTNAFLIGDGIHSKVLIDPSPQDNEEYRKFLNTVNLFGVDKILLTHHHPDHHERSIDLARALKIPVLLSRYTFKKLTDKMSDYFKDIEVHFLKEGDTVTHWLDRKVVVYEIPGHDEGQLALAAEDMSWFIAGDLFQGVGTVVIGGEEGDMQKYFQTLERVIQLNPRVVFPSHGIGLGGVSILERTLEHRRVREQQVLELHSKGHEPQKILEIIYHDVSKELWPYALHNIHKHLEKLKRENKI